MANKIETKDKFKPQHVPAVLALLYYFSWVVHNAHLVTIVKALETAKKLKFELSCYREEQ